MLNVPSRHYQCQTALFDDERALLKALQQVDKLRLLGNKLGLPLDLGFVGRAFD